jgi:hypothetical protein
MHLGCHLGPEVPVGARAEIEFRIAHIEWYLTHVDFLGLQNNTS